MLPVEAQMTALGVPPVRFADRRGHAAVLEGTGRVQPLELDEQLEPAAQLFRQAPGRDERRIAFQQGHRPGMGRQVEQALITLQNALIT